MCSVMLITHCDHPKLKVQVACPLMHLTPLLLHWDLFHPLTKKKKKKKDMIITMAPGQMAMSQLNHPGDKLLGMS